MTHRATLRFTYPTSRRADLVERALRPEVGRIEGDRSSTRVDRDGETISVVIEAEDPSALRAAKNTWFSLVRVAEGTITG